MFRVLRSASKAALLLAASLIVGLLAFSMLGEPSYAEGVDDYQFGTAEIWSTFNGEMLEDSYYYSDSWFLKDPEIENDGLALLSMQAVASLINDEEDSTGAAFLKKLGFTDIGFYGIHLEYQVRQESQGIIKIPAQAACGQEDEEKHKADME